MRTIILKLSGIACLILVIITCKKNEDLSTKDLLTAHKLRLSKTETYFAGENNIEAIDITHMHEEECEQDDFWIFDENYG